MRDKIKDGLIEEFLAPVLLQARGKISIADLLALLTMEDENVFSLNEFLAPLD